MEDRAKLGVGASETCPFRRQCATAENRLQINPAALDGGERGEMRVKCGDALLPDARCIAIMRVVWRVFERGENRLIFLDLKEARTRKIARFVSKRLA